MCVIIYLGGSMQIKSYKKGPKNTYILTIDNDKYTIYDDVIINNNLLLKKSITKDELNMVLNNNDTLKCYYEALNYLNRKMRSKKEIYKYLKQKDYDIKMINNTIEKLEKQKYLDDNKYVNAYVSDAIRFNNYGPNKIRENLKNLGIEETLINNKLLEIKEDTWFNKCQKLAIKKEKANHKDSPKIKKEKIKQYLITNGYEIKVINSVLENMNFKFDIDALQKEYNKQKLRLSKKYTGEKLRYQIEIKLKLKGYSEEEISKIVDL